MTIALDTNVLKVTSLTVETRTKKQMFPIPGGAPIIIDMGYEGPIYQLVATIDDTELTAWQTITAGKELTATGSTYDEMPNSGDKYYLESININRAGGTVDKWNLKLSLIKADTANIITQVT